MSEFNAPRRPDAGSAEPGAEPAMSPVATPKGRATGRPDPRRLGVVAGAALVVLTGAAVTMGASPSAGADASQAPAATANPTNPTNPTTSNDPGRPGFGPGFGFGGRGGHDGGFFGGDRRGGIFGQISITAISGTSISLKTDDGWTRTIAVGGDVAITKAGATIALGDLAVGDAIRLAETRNADGTYTITRIAVVLPTVVGSVTAKTADTLTIQHRDGTTVTVHVDADTTYEVGGVTNATLASTTVGMQARATGTQRTDGSIDALGIHAGTFAGRDGRGPWGPNGGDHAPAPSTTP